MKDSESISVPPALEHRNQKVYPIKMAWRLYAHVFLLMAIGMPYLLVWPYLTGEIPSSTLTRTSLIVFGFLIFCLCLACYLTVLRIRLVVSDSGITYHMGFGSRMETTWENIERIGPVPIGQYKYDGLLLKQSVKAPGWIHLMAKAYPLLLVLALLGGRAVPSPSLEEEYGQGIPLELFARNWRNSPLGNDIQRHIPGIFT